MVTDALRWRYVLPINGATRGRHDTKRVRVWKKVLMISTLRALGNFDLSVSRFQSVTDMSRRLDDLDVDF